MIEKKAFRELALGAGAREVELYEGSELPIAGFDYSKIKEANSGNGNTNVGRQVKKKNHLLLVVWVVIVFGVLWVSNQQA